ncbi:MAG: hypothetical protein WC791_04785 [Candidatus Paceibacterota bacterium]
MKRTIIAVFAIVAVAMLSGCATSNDPSYAYKRAFGTASDTISYRPAGGNLKMFEGAAREVKKAGRQIKIDGECLGECALFADYARTNVCITPNAKFEYRMAILVPGLEDDEDDYRPISITSYDMHKNMLYAKLSPGIIRWIEGRAGFPFARVHRMDYQEATKFWKPCAGEMTAAVSLNP